MPSLFIEQPKIFARESRSGKPGAVGREYQQHKQECPSNQHRKDLGTKRRGSASMVKRVSPQAVKPSAMCMTSTESANAASCRDSTELIETPHQSTP